MNLQNLRSFFNDNGCTKIYTKILAPNDNSKNQVYLGGSFEVLNILPASAIVCEEAGAWEKERFKASLNFSWVGEEGVAFPAPFAQLILYPKYPEVRFSGFLRGCESPPSSLMASRDPDRILFLAVSFSREIFGYVASGDSQIAAELRDEDFEGDLGVFKVLSLHQNQDSRSKLLGELKRIAELDWIRSKKLDREGVPTTCESTNCAGYTLEAELGITPNGNSEPDFCGWEIKQFGVKNFSRVDSAIITLMTPEPTGGVYKSEGVVPFLEKYGYEDRRGRADRINFGGIHKVGARHNMTGLTLRLEGFDSESGKIRNAAGKISLCDDNGVETASWNFAELMLHWTRKHNQACYVPSLKRNVDGLSYKFGNKVILGQATDFQFFLQQMDQGHIYYDPGIKMEHISTNAAIKRRSQFRIKSLYLRNLYARNEIVDL